MFSLVPSEVFLPLAVYVGAEISQSRIETDWIRSYRRRKVSYARDKKGLTHTTRDD